MTNLALYRKIIVLKNVLEMRDEKGVETSKASLAKSIALVDQIFETIERRSK